MVYVDVEKIRKMLAKYLSGYIVKWTVTGFKTIKKDIIW